MTSVFSSTVTYTIPLDNLNDAQLWKWIINNSPETSNNGFLNQKKYHEFQIHAEKIPQDSCLTCYICNIEVPWRYKKEHNESKKHKIYSEIAKISLERTYKQQFSNEQNEGAQFKNKNFYYCDSCAEVVENSNKEIHESSTDHKDSLLNEHLLGQMLEHYADKSVPLARDVEKILNRHKEIKENKKKKELEVANITNGTNDATKTNMPLKSYLYVINANRIGLGCRNNYIFYDENSVGIYIGCRYHPIAVPVQNFLGYSHKSANEAQCLICNTGRVYVGEEIEKHKYTLEHMQNLIKSEPDTNSLIQISDNKKYCIVCNKSFLCKNNVSSHFLTTDHDNNYITAISNPHTIDQEIPLDDYLTLISSLYPQEYVLRAINNEKIDIKFSNGTVLTVDEDNLHGFYGNMGYCCSCSEKSNIEDIRDHHKYTLKHIENILLGIDSKNSFRKTKNGRQYCIVCKHIVQTTLVPHEIDPVHRLKLRQAFKGDRITLSDIPDSIKTQNNSPAHKTGCQSNGNTIKANINTDKNEVLPNVVNCVSNTSNKENEIEEVQTYQLCYQSSTKAGLTNQNKITLHEEISHQNDLLTDRYGESSKDFNNTFVETKEGIINLLGPVIKCSSKSTVVSKKYINKNINKAVKGGHTYCEICNREIQTHNFQSHLKGSQHKEQMIKHTETKSSKCTVVSKKNIKMAVKEGHTYCEICNREIQTHNFQSHLKGNLHKEQMIKQCNFMFQTTKSSRVFCKVCKVNVTYNSLNIDEHRNGSNHKNCYMTLTKDNKFNIVNGKIYCELCDLEFAEKSMFDHIIQAGHQARLAKENETYKIVKG